MTEPLEFHLIDQASRSRIGFWHRVRARTVTDQIAPGDGAVVCDLGAGAGSLGSILLGDRPRATYRFFEPIESLASMLEQSYGPEARLPQPEAVGNADVVALLDVVEHVSDDREFLGGIAESMAPGATLVVTVPALPVLWSSWDEELGHYRRYTRSTMESLARALPVDVVEISYLFPEFLAPALVRRVLRRWPRSSDAPAADFPEFAPAVDRLLLTIATASYRLRRFWPAGTSLVLVARRSASD